MVFQTQVFHNGPAKPANDAAVMGNAHRIDNSEVYHLVVGDVIEDDLPLFLLADLLVSHLATVQSRCI
ncbi:MAG: hypothetical protein ACUVQ6_03685 [Dissulfurimicrobium sp.]|uniref:hypothetical protein n=1 Tax=Dissulfurimicrobium sp. TaxID=2022436 RepID=UPI004049060C